MSAVAGDKRRAFCGSPLRSPQQPETRSDRRRCSQPLCSGGSWTLGGAWAGSPWSPSPPDHSCCSPMRTPSKGKSQEDGEKSNKQGIITGTPKKRQDSSGFITTLERHESDTAANYRGAEKQHWRLFSLWSVQCVANVGW